MYPSTKIEQSKDVGLLRALAVTQIESMPAGAWRHHGIGVLQGYVNEGNGVERRIHIWDPSLVLPGMSESGSIHDHRFDMTSHVLLGAIVHQDFESWPSEHGPFEEYALVNAREAMRRVGRFHADPAPTGQRFAINGMSTIIHAGERYTFAKHRFHSTIPIGRGVSIVEKRNQSGSARILGRVGTPIRHAFGNAENVTDETAIASIVGSTLQQLREAA